MSNILDGSEPDPEGDPATEHRNFATFRSHQDSKISNENSRAAAQAAILINGGAASGVLAFLSKDKIDPHVLSSAAFALGAYAMGVAFGALVIWCMNQALKEWANSWQRVMKDPKLAVADTIENRFAGQWYAGSNISFVISISAFVIGSVMLARAITFSPEAVSVQSTQQPTPSVSVPQKSAPGKKAAAKQ